tara:strand:- start:5618 stop:7114 length:1497 start_codon:yes stop_codon:yes gene_type:complete
MVTRTTDQEKIFELSKKDWDILIITGAAGTGKTTLLKEIRDEYKKNGWEIFPAAFTGRAAAVLRQKGLVNARTIHFQIWGRPTMYVEFKKFFKLIKLKFTRKVDDNELWLIDEASMLHESLLTNLFDFIHNPEREKKLGLFGAKLNELYKDSKFEVKRNKKIIFCGDENQLPPIWGNSKPALDSQALKKIGYEVKVAKLTTLIRHKDSTLIQKYATDLEISSGKILPGMKEEADSLEEIEFLDSQNIDDIANTFLNLYNQNPFSVKFISYVNQSVHEFNMYIRTKIHNLHPRQLLVERDLIHVTKNNYFYDLWNGDHLIVMSVDKTFEGPELEVNCYIEDLNGQEVARLKKGKKYRNIVKKVSLSFTRVNVMHVETKKETTLFVIDETLNNQEADDFIYRERENLIHEVSEYLHKFFQYRHRNFNELSPDERKKSRETDEYNNALFINYSYGITGHKSQGGEWDTTIVDLNSPYKPQKGWIYTATTRASKKVYIIPKN